MRSSIAALGLALALTASAAYAAGSLKLQTQDSVQIVADQCDLAVTHSDHQSVYIACGPKWTPTPVQSPPAAPAQPPASEMHESVPICTDHSPTKWHPLVKRDAGGAITCTYGHEHHDDPNTVNDVFGPPGAWAGIAGQEISYPWQTSSAAGLENAVKHEGYKVYTSRDHPCVPVPGASSAGRNDGCFRAWRIQVHAMGHANDATTRHHSFRFEAVVQHPDGTQGMIRHGGWIDTGHLVLKFNGPTGGTDLCPAVPSNPATFVCGANVRKSHSGANGPAGYTGHDTVFDNWYATHKHTAAAVHIESFGPIDYQMPSNQLYFPGALKRNNSRGRPELLNVALRQGWWNAYKNAASIITYSGFTNSDGIPYGVNPANGSGTPSMTCPAGTPVYECVPFHIEGVKAYDYNWSASTAQTGHLVDREHDVPSPITGNSLIRYPN